MSVAAGLLAGSQVSPPQLGGSQVTLRNRVFTQFMQSLHAPQLPVRQTPLTGVLPVQPWESCKPRVPSSLRHCWPPQAGVGSLQLRVSVPLAPQAVAEQLPQSDQPPLTGVLPVQARVSRMPKVPSSNRHCRPPQVGGGTVHVRICVPLAPQAVAEQLPHMDQPPGVGVTLGQVRLSLVPRVPSSFRQSRPPFWGDGLLHVRVCLPPPQGLSGQILQADQPPLRGHDGFVPVFDRRVEQSPVLQPALQVLVWVKDWPKQTVERAGVQGSSPHSTGQSCVLQDCSSVSVANPGQAPPHTSLTVLLLVLVLLCLPPSQSALQVSQSLHCPQAPH